MNYTLRRMNKLFKKKTNTTNKNTNPNKKRKNRYIKNGIIAGLVILTVLGVAVGVNLVYGIVEETAEIEV